MEEASISVEGRFMYLEKINSPADLAGLSVTELEQLAAEIRELVIETVSVNGGHLGASLGTVELILALHRVFKVPEDRLLFDVGHQAYAHKILTGRREFFKTLRRHGGCAGFPAAWESEFDVGASGHAGTAISTAVGLSAAFGRSGSPHRAVAVVGDGALNCGMSLEGMINASRDGKNLIVVLNDNKMSIQENVGGMAHYLNCLISGSSYNKFKMTVKRLLKTLPRHEAIHRFIKRTEDLLKGIFLPGIVFEQLGFRYIGPINGHSLPDLLRTLERVRELEGPILVHVITEKGRGYEFARQEPARYHGVAGFDRATGRLKKSEGPTFSNAFGDVMVRLGEAHPEVAAISAAMVSGTGLNRFQQKFPGRCFDVGICEEHAVTFAGGLAAGGMRPVCAIYSTFLQRAFDSIYHDVVLPKLPVILALDRGGAVEDGPTHHGIYDLGFLRELPGLTVMAPRSERELELMLDFAYELKAPAAVRYPRGGSPADPAETVPPLELGRAEVVRAGGDGPVIWAMGPEVYTALEAARLLEAAGKGSCTVVNARFLAPFDGETARRLAASGRPVATVEDHRITGGLASALDEALADAPHGKVLHFGWPDRVIPHGCVGELKREFGLTAEAVAEKLGSL